MSTGDGAEQSSRPAPPPPDAHAVPLEYATPTQPTPRPDWQFHTTWSALLVLGLGLFVGGLVFLFAGLDGNGGLYLLVVGIAVVAMVRATRARSYTASGRADRL